MSKIELVAVDYQNSQHANDLVSMLDHYASDVSGGGEPLSAEVRQSLAARLATRSDADSVLAYVDNRPAGLLNCFEGFSTFAARPLLNIHDVIVHQDFRRRGIARRLLNAARDIAIRRGCCKMTLEVLSENRGAVAAYKQFGFERYQLDPTFGPAVFMEMKLDGAASLA
ncbi:GNAT family N-acetyltransferase [Crateriforma spongiae]|uniref:GNAT family N-acetyltransferase n=1 Tax=Crateriforma spongiae TaxID=2724528 RepID=UPI001446E72C|nr:GNAT family N-acetyltransferase [Crateriforma spongiae]